MIHGFRPDARFTSCIGLGLILLVLLVLPASLPRQARAQQANTPTPTFRNRGLFQPQVTLVAPPILITKSAPTFVVTDVRVLNLNSVKLAGETTKTTADIAFSDQFTATINVQSPTSMLIGESKVITLEVIPEFLAQAAMVRAELHALKFDSVDDGYPEKTIVVNIPVRWNWNIAPKEVGEQEFFLAISYVNNQGSRVHWQNITLNMRVSPAATATNPPTVTPSDTQAPQPFNTDIPTWTPSPTNSPEATLFYTPTPTDSFSKRIADDVAENPAPYLASLVTLMLGLLGVYFQYIRKSDKGSDSRNK